MRAACALVLAAAAAAPAASAPPPSWQPAIAALDMLYASAEPAVLPVVGNGFMATTIASDALYVSGLFNGYLTEAPSHLARVPAPLAVSAPGTVCDVALQLREATYYRRSYIDPTGAPCLPNATASCTNAATRVFVEQRCVRVCVCGW